MNLLPNSASPSGFRGPLRRVVSSRDLWTQKPRKSANLCAAMERNISREQIWHKIIREFNREKLKYVLVGGAALAIHGLPRSTLDLDIYLPAKEGIMNKLFQITDTLGLDSRQRDILKISHSPNLFAGQWICFAYKKQDILDIFFAEEQEFNQLYRHAERKHDRNISVTVASLDDIARMKKFSARSIDKNDLTLIKKITKGRLGA